MTDTIKVLIFKEGDLWVAQGIERDICVQAYTLEDVQINFEVAVRLESECEGGIMRIPAAPEYFQEQWSRRAGTFTPVNSSHSREDVEYGVAA
jgi:hypothetical protein